MIIKHCLDILTEENVMNKNFKIQNESKSLTNSIVSLSKFCSKRIISISLIFIYEQKNWEIFKITDILIRIVVKFRLFQLL